MADEYKPMGISMSNLTIGYGGLLIAWGIAASLLSGSNSVTSFIPSIMGVPLLISGLMTNLQPDKRNYGCISQ